MIYHVIYIICCMYPGSRLGFEVADSGLAESPPNLESPQKVKMPHLGPVMIAFRV